MKPLLVLGQDFVYEPAVTSMGTLEMREARAGEKQSDFAVHIENRPVNVEIKTPLPMAERPPANYGVFRDEFARRAAQHLRDTGEAYDMTFIATRDLVAEPRDVGKFGKSMGRAIREAAAAFKTGGALAGVSMPLVVDGVKLGTLALKGGEPRHDWAYSMNGPHLEIESLFDSGQLPTYSPNVVVIGLQGEIFPFPPNVRDSLLEDGDLKGTFAAGRYTRISAVLAEYGNDQRWLFSNPRAAMPLTAQEELFFKRHYPLPAIGPHG